MIYSQEDLDNHSNQLNPNNDAYWQSRGYEERPEDWDEDNPNFLEDLSDPDNWYYEPWCSDDFE